MRFNNIADLQNSKVHYIEFFNYYSSLSENYQLYDLFVATIINRAIALNEGFNKMIDESNYIAAIPLVRLQIDNLIYCYAGTVAEDSIEFFKGFIEGKNWNKLKDYNGNELKENYLLDKLCSIYGSDILKSLYKDTSNYIHFSASHILQTLYKIEDSATIHQRIGYFNVPDQINDVLNIMLVINQHLEDVLTKSYVNTRINDYKQLIKLRHEHPEMSDGEIFGTYGFSDPSLLKSITKQIKIK